MGHQHAHLLERALVQQQVDTFPGGELALLVLGLDAYCTAAFQRLGLQTFERLNRSFVAMVMALQGRRLD